jgi:hypothetical protein
VRRVLDQIRGRKYEDALAILEYMPYKACEPIMQTLLSVRIWLVPICIRSTDGPVPAAYQ